MTKLEQAARQALGALELHCPNFVPLVRTNTDDVRDNAITALRKALAERHKENCACEVCRGCDNADIKAEQAEQEPVAIVVCNRFGVISLQRPDGGNFNLGKNVGMKFYTAPQPVKQEPVAWYGKSKTGNVLLSVNCVDEDWKPLYASPVRTKDLTDDEILELYGQHDWSIDFARAVIEKFKEKNRG